MMKSARASAAVTPRTQGQTTSQAPRATLSHSSQGSNTDSVTTSVRMRRKPTMTAFCVDAGSPEKPRAHGEMHSQIPSIQLTQSCQCVGGVKVTGGMGLTEWRSDARWAFHGLERRPAQEVSVT